MQRKPQHKGEKRLNMVSENIASGRGLPNGLTIDIPHLPRTITKILEGYGSAQRTWRRSWICSVGADGEHMQLKRALLELFSYSVRHTCARLHDAARSPCLESSVAGTIRSKEGQHEAEALACRGSQPQNMELGGELGGGREVVVTGASETCMTHRVWFVKVLSILAGT